MKRALVGVAAACLLLLAVPLVMVTALLGGLPGPTPALPGVADPIPATMLALYRQAAGSCPGLSWAVLAAIGTVESDNGQSTLPGVHSGHNAAGAEGPMQFEPATFARFGHPAPPGGADPPSPYDPVDAVFAAARMLCADGAGDPLQLPVAVFDYNHSAAYVDQVVSLAGLLVAGSSAPVDAVAWAMAQLGTPYRWGGETPGVAFDCSGLVQAAWRAAGVQLPRVAAAQFAAGPLLPAGAALEPGDLVFFGPPHGGVTHVGMVVGPGQMIDAPHTGAVVRVEPFPAGIGAAWGGDVLVGATRPGGW